MQVVILAAGKGARLQPLTLTRSKAMAPVAGKPLVELVVESLGSAQVDELILVVSPADEAIHRYFAGRADPPVRLVVQHERQGMAKALALAAPYLTGPFVMSACDNLTSAGHVAELVDQHRNRQAAATLSLMEVERAAVSKTGVVVWEPPWVQRIVEKPSPEAAPSTIASLPLYVFAPEILDCLPLVQPSPRGEYELQDAIQMLIEQTGRVTGVFAPARQQVTNAADLLALNLAALAARSDTQEIAQDVELGAGVTLVPPLVIGPQTVIGPGACIGPRVYIEGYSRVGSGAVIQDAVLLRGATVDAGGCVSSQIAG
jgi:glucose-1-phosphate thymidylyltransferase